MKGAVPPQRSALYAKVSYCFRERVKVKLVALQIVATVKQFFTVLKSRAERKSQTLA